MGEASEQGSMDPSGRRGLAETRTQVGKAQITTRNLEGLEQGGKGEVAVMNLLEPSRP